jgi:hypothetical protein
MGGSLSAARAFSRMGGLVVVLWALLGPAAVPAHAAELYLVDEREIYVALDKLNAMGLLPGFLANTRPYDMKGVRAAIDNAPRAVYGDTDPGSDFAQWVRFYTSSTAMLRGTASLSWAERTSVPENNGGTSVPEGVSAGFSALGRYEPYAWLSGNAKQSFFFAEGGDSTSRLEESSVEVGYKYASVQAGKISAWYGPGRSGALIYTNNAQSYPGVRLHNPVPIPVPGFFSFLGNVQYDWFLARLDDSNRPVPNPLLSGIRLAARPNRYFEFGVSRSIQYGGDGQDESLGTYLDILIGRRESAENTPVGNSLASIDVDLHLPFRLQPVSLYGEWGGEDQSQAFIFTRHAWLAGIFLPSFGPFATVDFRLEYGTTKTTDPGIWYQHSYYPHEYRGQILGHPMGTDARELWLQGHWFFLPSTYLELTVDRVEREFPGPATEKENRFEVAFIGWFTRSLRARAGIQNERIDNAGGVAGSDQNNFMGSLVLSWQYSGRHF